MSTWINAIRYLTPLVRHHSTLGSWSTYCQCSEYTLVGHRVRKYSQGIVYNTMASVRDRFKCSDVVTFTDPDGCTIKYRQIKGTNVNFIPFIAKSFFEFPDIVARADDVMICGYQKAGTHWMWEVTCMLMKNSAEYERSAKVSVMLEFAGKSVNHDPSPRILNTHMPLNYLPPDTLVKKCKIIYLLRNPKDLAVSQFNHIKNLSSYYGYSGKWSGFLELFLEGKVDYGGAFDYMLDWEKAIGDHPELPIHVWYYEDMKKDPEKETRKLVSFLGLSVKDDVIKEIVDKCSFKKMRDAKGGGAWACRKGEVGDWKNWFSDEQNVRFDAKYKEKMRESKLNFTYEL